MRKVTNIILLALMVLPIATFAQSFPEGNSPNEHNLDGVQWPRPDAKGHACFRIYAPDALKANGLENIVYYESQGTAHEWLTWRRSLREFVPLLFK